MTSWFVVAARKFLWKLPLACNLCWRYAIPDAKKNNICLKVDAFFLDHFWRCIALATWCNWSNFSSCITPFPLCLCDFIFLYHSSLRESSSRFFGRPWWYHLATPLLHCCSMKIVILRHRGSRFQICYEGASAVFRRVYYGYSLYAWSIFC